jgi:hypothetical protein
MGLMAEHSLFNQRYLTQIKSHLNTGRFRSSDFAIIGRNDGITIRYEYKPEYNLIITIINNEDTEVKEELSFNLSYCPGMVLQGESLQQVGFDDLGDSIAVRCERTWENQTADATVRHLSVRQIEELRRIELAIREIDPDDPLSEEGRSRIAKWLESQQNLVQSLQSQRSGIEEIAHEVLLDIETLYAMVDVLDASSWWKMAFVRIRNWTAAPTVPTELLEGLGVVPDLISSFADDTDENE